MSQYSFARQKRNLRTAPRDPTVGAIARFRVFPPPKRGYSWLDFSDGKMVEIGRNLALIWQNLALFLRI